MKFNIDYKTCYKIFKKCTYKYKINEYIYKEELEDLFQDVILECLSKDNPTIYFTMIIGYRILDFKEELDKEHSIDLECEEIWYNFEYKTFKDINFIFKRVLTPEDYKLISLKLKGYSNKEIGQLNGISESWMEKRFTRIFWEIKEQKELFINLI